MLENDDGEEPAESEGERRDMSSRAKDVIKSARQQVSQSIDVMTGADIRRFDEFTDATTRAVVGVHQDLSEVREQAARTHCVVDDIQEREQRLTERLEQLEQSVRSRTSLLPWIVAVGAAAVALVLSVFAVLMSVS